MARWMVGMVLAALAVPSPVAADPAEPTSMQGRVVAITPEVDGLEVRVVGGDSFLEVHNRTGREVVVLGYDGEPYLRFRPDGTVEENRATRTYALNADRYAAAAVSADTAVDDEWTVVTRTGAWAWHDHRTHWMSPTPPMGLGPGDQVVDGVVPLLVGGLAVEVSVVSVWVAPPSPWAMVVGVGVAVAVVASGWRRRLDGRLVVAASAAVVVTVWERASLPSPADPGPAVLALPSASLLALLIAHRAARRHPPSTWVLLGARLVAVLELLLWAVQRRAVVHQPVLPTGLWWPLDRAVTVFVAPMAVGALLWTLVRAAHPGWSRLGVDANRHEPVDDLRDLHVGQ